MSDGDIADCTSISRSASRVERAAEMLLAYCETQWFLLAVGRRLGVDHETVRGCVELWPLFYWQRWRADRNPVKGQRSRWRLKLGWGWPPTEAPDGVK